MTYSVISQAGFLFRWCRTEGRESRDEQFREAICCGIRKINIATANFDALTKGAADYLAESKEHNYFELNEQMVRYVCENVKKCIKVFNNREATPKNGYLQDTDRQGGRRNGNT